MAKPNSGVPYDKNDPLDRCYLAISTFDFSEAEKTLLEVSDPNAQKIAQHIIQESRAALEYALKGNFKLAQGKAKQIFIEIVQKGTLKKIATLKETFLAMSEKTREHVRQKERLVDGRFAKKIGL